MNSSHVCKQTQTKLEVFSKKGNAENNILRVVLLQNTFKIAFEHYRETFYDTDSDSDCSDSDSDCSEVEELIEEEDEEEFIEINDSKRRDSGTAVSDSSNDSSIDSSNLSNSTLFYEPNVNNAPKSIKDNMFIRALASIFFKQDITESRSELKLQKAQVEIKPSRLARLASSLSLKSRKSTSNLDSLFEKHSFNELFPLTIIPDHLQFEGSKKFTRIEIEKIIEIGEMDLMDAFDAIFDMSFAV